MEQVRGTGTRRRLPDHDDLLRRAVPVRPAGRVRAGAQRVAAALPVQRCPADVAGAGRQHRR